MLRYAIYALTAVFLATLPAHAFDINAMSDSERAAFRAEIRNYLLQNPEVLMEAISVLEQRRADQTAEAETKLLSDNSKAIFEDANSYVGGNPKGDVTVVEFMDYRCGYCRKAFPQMEELLKSDGRIRFIVKEYPILGDASVLGARYAIATRLVAGDAAYKNVHDAMMTLRGDLNDAALKRLSSEFDLDHDKILAKMDSAEINNIIHANYTLGQKLQIQGTPTFVMGDKFVRGYVDLDQMRQFVQAARSQG